MPVLIRFELVHHGIKQRNGGHLLEGFAFLAIIARSFFPTSLKSALIPAMAGIRRTIQGSIGQATDRPANSARGSIPAND